MINDPSKEKLLEIKVISNNLLEAIINTNRDLRSCKGRVKLKDGKVYLVFPDRYYPLTLRRNRNLYVMIAYNNNYINK